MADFCMQCSIELFGRDYKELANLIQAPVRVLALCEDCGYTTVDQNGKCISETCPKHGILVQKITSLLFSSKNKGLTIEEVSEEVVKLVRTHLYDQ